MDTAERLASTCIDSASKSNALTCKRFVPQSRLVSETSNNSKQWSPQTAIYSQNASGIETTRREVLSILNKVTAENFISLSKTILNINVESAETLDIIVQLIFQKAATEPKFTPLYAQLCVILCEKSRNFELDNHPLTTFKLLLLKRCENEFCNRTQINFTDSRARQRFLGGIRFIAELGRAGTIPEKVLYECIKALLSRKSKPKQEKLPTPQMGVNVDSGCSQESEALALDMECLCQFLKITGQYMDTVKARNLMDQFFDRLHCILQRGSPSSNLNVNNNCHAKCVGGSANLQGSVRSSGVGKYIPLNARIRFMITDILELRQNRWVPRHMGQQGETEKPRLLSDIRREIEIKTGTFLEPSRSERSPSHQEVPGSAYHPNAADSSSSNSRDPEHDWMELNRMGKALCSRNQDYELFGSGPTNTHSRQRNQYTYHHQQQYNQRNNNTTRRDQYTNSSNYQEYRKQPVTPPAINGRFPNTNRGTTHDLFIKTETGSTGNIGSNNVWSRGAVLRGNCGGVNATPQADCYNLPPRILRKPPIDASQQQSSHTPVTSGFFEPEYLCNRTSGGVSSSSPISSHLPVSVSSASSGIPDSIISSSVSTRPTNSSILSGYPDRSGDVRLQSNGTSYTIPCRRPRVTQQLAFTTGNNAKLPPLIIYPVNSGKTVVHDENKEVSKTVLSALESAANKEAAMDLLREKNLLTRLNKDVLSRILIVLCDGSSAGNSNIGMNSKSKAVACLLVSVLFEVAQFSKKGDTSSDGVNMNAVWLRVIQTLSSTSAKSSLAFIVSRLLITGLLKLEEVAAPLSAGHHHFPLFLLVLQQLAQMIESDAKPGQSCKEDFVEDGDFIPVASVDNADYCLLTSIFGCCDKEKRREIMAHHFHRSRIVMTGMLPEGSQTPSRMHSLLEERGLSFLLPELQVARELSDLLSSEDQIANLSIFTSRLETLDADCMTSDFVHSLMAACFARVRRLTCGINTSSSSGGEEELVEAEKNVWEVLAKARLGLCLQQPSHQLDALHALQVFWHESGFIKGFLLRCFMNMYDFDLVDENTFLTWREEVDQNYPAKGQALFEVNRWLTWLEHAEVEEEDEEENAIKDDSEQGNDDILSSLTTEQNSSSENSSLAYFEDQISRDTPVVNTSLIA